MLNAEKWAKKKGFDCVFYLVQQKQKTFIKSVDIQKFNLVNMKDGSKKKFENKFKFNVRVQFHYKIKINFTNLFGFVSRI